VAAVPLREDALALATRAWRALRAPDPRGFADIVAARSPELRFMGEAFDRLGREYPWTRDGLSLTERRLLAAIAEGAATGGPGLHAAARRASRVPTSATRGRTRPSSGWRARRSRWSR
jgi:hypothetical protein